MGDETVDGASQLELIRLLYGNLQCSRKAAKGVCLLSEREWGVGRPNGSCWMLGRAAALQKSAANVRDAKRIMSR